MSKIADKLKDNEAEIKKIIVYFGIVLAAAIFLAIFAYPELDEENLNNDIDESITEEEFMSKLKNRYNIEKTGETTYEYDGLNIEILSNDSGLYSIDINFVQKKYDNTLMGALLESEFDSKNDRILSNAYSIFKASAEILGMKHNNIADFEYYVKKCCDKGIPNEKVYEDMTLTTYKYIENGELVTHIVFERIFDEPYIYG